MASATAYLYSLDSFNINFTNGYGDPLPSKFPNSTPDYTAGNGVYGGSLSIKPNYSVDSFSFDTSYTSFSMDSAQGDGADASTLQVDQADSLFGSENLAVGDQLRLLYGVFLVDPNTGEKIELYMISRFDNWDGAGDNEYHLLGLAAKKPLDPSVNYTVLQGDPANPSPAVADTYPELADLTGPLPPPCFARGTMIETDRGAVAVESLSAGDLIVTRDNGLQPIRWVGSRVLDGRWLAVKPNLKPVRIAKGALGAGLPNADLVVSPQHRILVRSAIAQKMFGTGEVLVAAKQLLQIDGIDIVEGDEGVEYFHILFDRHEVVISNGAETESLYPGPEALKTIGAAALDEVLTIFPELADDAEGPVAARELASGRMGRKLAVRHAQNDKPLVS